MNYEQTKNLISQTVQNFIDVCPHCGTRAHLQMLFNESHKQKNGDAVYYITFRCVPCHKLVFETYRFNQNRYSNSEDLSTGSWEDKFPTEEVILTSKFEGAVPDDVLEDFREGVICLHRKCDRAAVSMFRRSLQSALLERGVNQGNDLINQIKNATFLTKDIKDWAHNIRIFGNWGAHPQDDNLKDVNDKLAEETQSFLEEFFNYVYVMPARVANARQKNVSAQEIPSEEVEK
jgi:hypothetical protein